MERNVKRRAIVLNTKRINEIDRSLSLLTEDNEIIDVIVYGGQKSLKAIKVPLYTIGVFSLYYNGKKYSIKDVEIIKSFDNISSDLETSFSSSLLSEIALLDSSLSDLYALVLQALDVINKENYMMELIQFILTYIRLSGYEVDYIHCPLCNKKYDEEETLGFNSTIKASVCLSCDDTNQTFILPKNARRFLRDSNKFDFYSSLNLQISSIMQRRIFNYLTRYLKQIYSIELKCLSSGVFNILD